MNGALTTNKSAITVVTVTVAVLAAFCVSTICFLSYMSIQIPPELNTLAGTLCGYLTGVLSKTSPTEATKAPIVSGAPQDVNVVNPPSEPVPTTEAPK